jgi:hypothetical protein
MSLHNGLLAGTMLLVACGSDSGPTSSKAKDAGTGGSAGTLSDAASEAGASSGGSSGSGATGGSGGASGASGGSGGSTNPSGEAMPAQDLPGFKLIFSDDFVTDAPLGSFPGAAYGSGWTAYPDGWHDTSGNGQYSPGHTLSVQAGVLLIDVHTENGVHYVSAPEPMSGNGQVYGRYSVRFRATTTTSDYKTAWLLWPDSDKWPDDGEIDFPEGNLDGTIGAYAHHATPSGGQDAFDTSGVKYDGWHTATTEWSPGNVTFILDGQTLGVSTTLVPSKSMHYVMQTETNLDGIVPSDTSAGKIELDWVVIWAKN